MTDVLAKVIGLGHYLPERVVRNSDLDKSLNTNDEWIVSRTGIQQRHIAAENQNTSDLAANAGRIALADAGLTPDDIDHLIVATSSPELTFPATAVLTQNKLGMTRGAAMDVNAVCSGFVYAMSLADGLIRSGHSKRIMVIGAEIYSRLVDWKDRGTCILFGDGAGALILEATSAKDKRGILWSKLYSDGQYAEILRSTGGAASTKNAGLLTMQGKEVFRHAVQKMSDVVLEGLAALKLTTEQIDWLVPHQANQRILSACAERLQLPEEKVISTVGSHANTSAASIPLALAVAKAAGKLAPQQIVVLTALGAGLTWGSCIIRW